MAIQYWVGGFYIDLSRNQITQNKQSQTLAPKALAVLTYLAQNQGRVVSHDELMTEVWQNTVVSPNTLQRSIAQIRKALGDDGVGQTYIKTHAKQGYSLECDVRWDDNIAPDNLNELQENSASDQSTSGAVSAANSHTDKPDKAKNSQIGLKHYAAIAAMIVFGVIGSQFFKPQQSSQTTFDQLRSLTATDDKEFNATYSPDGKYIIFHRYLDYKCGNKLWAKNTVTQEEIQLTEEWGAYDSHSFSADGGKLVFFKIDICEAPRVQKNCYELLSLDFKKALERPQKPSLILQCKNSHVKRPKWIGDDNIAFMQSIANRWKLVNYSLSKDESSDLYDIRDGSLITYAYSEKEKLIAVTSTHSDGKHYIDMLKPDGRILSSNIIERPKEIPKFREIHPVFDTLNKQLIFSTGKQLFTLSYQGKVNKISLPFDEFMMPSEFHPNGKNLLLIKGRFDGDTAFITFNQNSEKSSVSSSEQNPSIQTITHTILERSIAEEDNAMFQPGSDLIAFRSERTGEDQIWISNGNGAQQLSKFPVDTYIGGIDWAADGESLLVNANNILTQVFLDSSQNELPLEQAVTKLFQWESENNTALLLVRIKGITKFVVYDLNNSTFKEITDKKVMWALRSEDGRLIYKDNLGQFWQPGPAEDQHINSLDGQGDRSKSFVIRGNVIFSINNENQFWSYDLDDGSFKILGELAEEVTHLTDVSQKQVLMQVLISEKKEVVELSLGQ